MFDPKFFLGIVTDNNDPDKRGRVRIRIMGIHTEITQPMDDLGLGIKEDDLPLAQCMYPVTYTGTKGTCPPPSLLPGDWVLGVSLDGNAYQNLMVLGLAKAKFNAESLADGSINAEDAFATTEKPTNDDGMAKMAEKAKALTEGKTALEMASVFTPDMKKHTDAYESAKTFASDFASGKSSEAVLSTSPDTSTPKPLSPVSNPVEQSPSPQEETVNKAIADATSSSFVGAAATGVETKLSPEYALTKLANLPSDLANSMTLPYNENSFNTALSVGSGVYNIVTYLNKKDSNRYGNFTSSSKLEFNPDATNPNSIVTETLGEGYYEYCYNYFNNFTDKKSDILPTFAYNMGVGETEDYLMWYGDPRTERCTYARMIQNMRNDGLITEADYMASVIKSLNKKNKTKIATVDPNAKNYLNHQYINGPDIISKKFRKLGTVVMPTLRSTMSQVYIKLPNYSNEGGYPHEHYGIDLMSSKIPVVSMADGTVTRVYNVNTEDNNAVVIKHPMEVTTMYMHMSPLKVKEGQKVKAGEVIGTANGYGEKGTNTTPVHLHFEIKYDTKLIDPYDFLVNKLGFIIKTLDTASMYKKDEISANSDIYKDIVKKYRKDKNIAWSF